MKNFSIKEAVHASWTIFKQDKKRLVLVSLVFLLLTGSQNLDMLMPALPGVVKVLIMIFFGILSMIVTIGWYKTLLRVVDGGRAEVKELFTHTSLFFKYLGSVIMLMLIVVVPAAIGAFIAGASLSLQPFLLPVVVVAIIIGVIYLVVRYNFALVIAIDKDLSIGQSFKKSAEITEGVKLKLIGLGIVVGLLNILGALALLVGLLASIPVSTLAYLYVYRKLYTQEVTQ